MKYSNKHKNIKIGKKYILTDRYLTAPWLLRLCQYLLRSNRVHFARGPVWLCGHLSFNLPRHQVLGRRIRRVSHARRSRRHHRPRQHGQLRHLRIRRRPGQGFHHGFLLRLHDDKRHGRYVSRPFLLGELLLWYASRLSRWFARIESHLGRPRLRKR